MNFSSPENPAASTAESPGALRLEVPDHQLVHRIGRGSYGEVWLARNVVGSWRAVKVVYRQSFDSDRPYEREFEGIRKSEPLSRSQDSLVDILQIGRNDRAGFFYYVMELADPADVEVRTAEASAPPEPAESHRAAPAIDPDRYRPRTLNSELHRCGRLPIARCVEIGLAMTGALAPLHQNGLVHRDVKPSNILYVGGSPKLGDIGLVAGLGEALSYVGTEGFIPPEGPGSPQADLYALGKVLYEISTGQDRTDFPQLPPEFQQAADRREFAELNQIILKACMADPRERYQSAAEMRADLAALQHGESIARKRAVARWWVRARWTGIGLLAVLVLWGSIQFVPVGLTTALLALVACVVAWWIARRRPVAATASVLPSTPIRAPAKMLSIAVLPFDNGSPDEADSHLGEELAIEFAKALTKIEALRVMPHHTARALRGADDRLAMARRIRLDALLEGVVRKNGQRLHVAAELIDARRGFLICSEIYDRLFADIFAIRTELALAVARGLRLAVDDSMRRQMSQRATGSLAAYDFYLLGRRYQNKRTPPDLWKATELFEKAIAIDPRYALAYAGLADAYWYLSYGFGSMDPREAAPKARDAALKALEIDSSLAEAHAALGIVHFMLEWDWDGAETEFKQAIQLNPQYPTAHHFYAILLAAAQQRFDEAVGEARRALELDPLSLPLNNFVGVMLFFAGRAEESIQHQTQWLEYVPRPADAQHELSFAHKMLGRAFESLGRHAETTEAYIMELTLQGVPIEVTEGLRASFQQAGWEGFVQAKLAALLAAWQRGGQPWFVAYEIAGGCAQMGEFDHAFQWLDRLYDLRCSMLIWAKIDPLLAPLRSDPRYAALLGKIGLDR